MIAFSNRFDGSRITADRGLAFCRRQSIDEALAEFLLHHRSGWIQQVHEFYSYRMPIFVAVKPIARDSGSQNTLKP
jgi:hypothetical protein